MPSKRKFGRKKRKPAQKSYVASNRRYRNKLKRVLRSSGVAEAKRWAAKYNGPS